jgi:hypothetical protein
MIQQLAVALRQRLHATGNAPRIEPHTGLAQTIFAVGQCLTQRRLFLRREKAHAPGLIRLQQLQFLQRCESSTPQSVARESTDCSR